MARPPRRRRPGEDDERPRREAPPVITDEPIGTTAWRREPAPAAAPAAPAPPAESPAPRLLQDDLLELARMDPAELAALLEGAQPRRRLEPGQKITGTITRVGRDTVFVDIGAKSEGQIDRAELPAAKAGEELTAFYVGEDDGGPLLTLALSGTAAAGHLEEARESGAPVEGKVTGRNSGGFDVRIGSVRAFCPASQISRIPEVDLDAYVGQTLAFKVLEAGDRVVVSRRALQDEEAEAKAAELWATIAPGQALRGTVRSVQPFGFFVDVGGIDGLVPRREIQWGADDPRTAVRVGQAVEVAVLEVDREARKLTLSARAREDDPWGAVGVGFVEGGIYTGKVLRTETYGAFVELAPGLTGLVHVTKLPAGLPVVGSALDVRLLTADLERRRLELAPVTAGEVASEPATSGEVLAKGVVAEVLRNGVVVQLDDGRTGWLPESEVDLPAGTVLAQRYRRNKAITARILVDDPRRVTLSARTRSDDQREWTVHQAHRPAAGAFGTLGDLLGKWQPKR
jgi:small subunit ribosomal protein S1